MIFPYRKLWFPVLYLEIDIPIMNEEGMFRPFIVSPPIASPLKSGGIFGSVPGVKIMEARRCNNSTDED